MVHDTNSNWPFVDPEWIRYDGSDPIGDLLDEALRRQLKGKLYESKDGNFRGYLMALPIEGRWEWTSFYLVPDPETQTYTVDEVPQSRPKPSGNR